MPRNYRLLQRSTATVTHPPTRRTHSRTHRSGTGRPCATYLAGSAPAHAAGTFQPSTGSPYTPSAPGKQSPVPQRARSSHVLDVCNTGFPTAIHDTLFQVHIENPEGVRYDVTCEP